MMGDCENEDRIRPCSLQMGQVHRRGRSGRTGSDHGDLGACCRHRPVLVASPEIHLGEAIGKWVERGLIARTGCFTSPVVDGDVGRVARRISAVFGFPSGATSMKTQIW